MSTTTCTSIYFRLRTVSMNATPEIETTGVPVRHIQRLLLEADMQPRHHHHLVLSLPHSGCWQEDQQFYELTNTYVIPINTRSNTQEKQQNNQTADANRVFLSATELGECLAEATSRPFGREQSCNSLHVPLSERVGLVRVLWYRTVKDTAIIFRSRLSSVRRNSIFGASSIIIMRF